MAEAQIDKWKPARLIPTAGIKGQEEQERRATSSLLAVMMAVPEFSQALLKQLGAPKASAMTYTEVPLKNPDGTVSIPDGAIIVQWGKSVWRALVEVKTNGAPLKAEQVGRYLDWARDLGFDGVLTISNDVTASPFECPVSVDKRKTKKVSLWHLSWWRITTEAVVQHRFRGISDPDQAWILNELITYLNHEASGASGFGDMGKTWVQVRDAAKHHTLGPSDPGVREVAERWDQYVDYLALGLAQELGENVLPVRPRKQVTSKRIDQLVKCVGTDGYLESVLKIPGAIAPIHIRADMRSQEVVYSATVDLPKDRRPPARVNWALKQLREGPADLQLTTGFASSRETSSALLAQALEDRRLLLSAADPKREPKTIQLCMRRKMGTKRGNLAGSFVRDTRTGLFAFYRDVVQNMNQWRPTAPKLVEPDSLNETDLSGSTTIVAVPEIVEIEAVPAVVAPAPPVPNGWGAPNGQTQAREVISPYRPIDDSTVEERVEDEPPKPPFSED